ncbi:conserved unknown protein [Nannochloropsis gaditana]|uniref:GPI transamidase subunit PIG-U n=1 Tax=Nannochloropsis gaditana TaxID=72520 RepID=W7UC99_9STRA|nr:conserved unknown protein [Nannochloropsis gaditana]
MCRCTSHIHYPHRCLAMSTDVLQACCAVICAVSRSVLLVTIINALAHLAAFPSSQFSANARIVFFSLSTGFLFCLLAYLDPLVASVLGLSAFCVSGHTRNISLAMSVAPSMILVFTSQTLRTSLFHTPQTPPVPNMGLWWYVMAEVFAQFDSYFRLVFAAHPFLYVPPLAFRVLTSGSAKPLPRRLLRLFFMVMAGIAILLHPHPILLQQITMDVALLTLHPTLLMALPSKILLLGVGMGVPLVLSPIMSYLWLDARSGNANYLYFQTLVWSALNALLLLEVTVVLVREAARAEGRGQRKDRRRESHQGNNKKK